LPQGCAKKIELQVLLPDLALQLADALAGRHKIVRGLNIEKPKALARPASRPKGLNSPRTVMAAPLVKLTPSDA